MPFFAVSWQNSEAIGSVPVVFGSLLLRLPHIQASWGWTKEPFCRCAISGFFFQFWRTSTNLGLVELSFQAFDLYLNYLERERERYCTRKNPTKVACDCNVGGVRMASISILPRSKLSMLRASFSQPRPFVANANFCHCSKATKTTFQT